MKEGLELKRVIRKKCRERNVQWIVDASRISRRSLCKKKQLEKEQGHFKNRLLRKNQVSRY